jgi:hypothetical protein
MTRAVTVPPAARAAFVAALEGSSDHRAAIPDPLPMGRVLYVVDRAVDSEEELKVLAGKDDQGYFLDYFRRDSDRDGYTYRHGRIRDNGTIESLENYEGQWGRQVYRDDPARTEAERRRMYAHNDRVREILRAKGFIR